MTTKLPYAERRPSEGDHSLSLAEKRAVLTERIATVQNNLRWYIRLLLSLEREEARLAALERPKPIHFMGVLAAQAGIVDEGVLQRAVAQLAERQQA